jgi:hypothetical protein
MSGHRQRSGSVSERVSECGSGARGPGTASELDTTTATNTPILTHTHTHTLTDAVHCSTDTGTHTGTHTGTSSSACSSSSSTPSTPTRTLSHSSLPPTPELRRTSSTRAPEMLMGFMHKEGSLVHSWKHRYFVLTSSSATTLLTYYHTQAPQGSGPPYGRHQKGQLDLKGYVVSDAPEEKSFFHLHTLKHIIVLSPAPLPPSTHSSTQSLAQRRVLKLAFQTEAALQMWKDALRDHIAFADNVRYRKLQK